MPTISEKIDEEKLRILSNHLLQTDAGFIVEWCCISMGSANRNFVTGGVYRVSGKTDAGAGLSRSWSIILKVVKADPLRDDPTHYNYWRREIMAYESGVLHELPENIVTPICYAIDKKDDGSVWLWLEDLAHDTRPWEWNDYAYVVGKLGEFHAAYLLGKPLPNFDWVNKHWMRSWIKECYQYRHVPDANNIGYLLSQKRAASILDRFTLFESSIDGCLEALEQLPKTLAHQDFYEQNILLDSGRQEDGKLALIDWQFMSISGIGEDLGRFLGLSVSRGQVPIEQFAMYQELFMSSYLNGLSHAGWHGDENLPRFGCLAAFALRSIWEVPKLLKKLEQNPESSECLQLLLITEKQMEAAAEVVRLLNSNGGGK
jgi:hypothetical protein